MRTLAVPAAHYLACATGKAHNRQMDGAARTARRAEILTGANDGGEAPSWLWSSVVELAGRHEVGYLRHCRTYGVREAA